jgi:3D (Asp-Asp-Asp) domain-containing protein
MNLSSIGFQTFKIALALFSLLSAFASSVASAKTVSIALADNAYTSTSAVVSRTWVDHIASADEPEVMEEPIVEPSDAPAQTIKVLYREMTAYTSRPQETDDSPCVSADGSVVFDGMVASNGLPFGTKFRIPDYFGDKVFEVRDRMNARYTTRIDIWMDNTKDMYQWGYKKNVKIEIIEMGTNAHKWNDPEMKIARKTDTKCGQK